MYHRDPLDFNLYAVDLPDEDGPTYLDEDAEPTLEELIEPEEWRGGVMRSVLGPVAVRDSGRQESPDSGGVSLPAPRAVREGR